MSIYLLTPLETLQPFLHITKQKDSSLACPARFERATLGFLGRGKSSFTYLLVDRFEFLNQVN